MSRRATPRHGIAIRPKHKQTPLIILLALVLMITASAPTRAGASRNVPHTAQKYVGNAYGSQSANQATHWTGPIGQGRRGRGCPARARDQHRTRGAPATTAAPAAKAANSSPAPAGVAAGAISAGPGKFAQGVYLTGSDAPRVPSYEAWLGKSVPLVEIFGDRSSESNLTQPNWAIDRVTALNKTVIIAWNFFISGSNEGWGNSANVNNQTSAGVTYAQRYQAFGTNLIAHGQANAIIRVASEFNNGSGGMPPVMDSQTDINNYVASFQGFVKVMRAIPGQHFTFDWDTSPDPGDPNDLTRAYPGDASVDVIGIDNYVTSVPWGSNWTNEQDEWNKRLNGYNGGKGYQFYLNFAKAHNKPTAFPEWGLGYYYSNNGSSQAPPEEPYFIQQMFNLMTNNNVLFESFWEDNNGVFSSPSSVNLTQTKAMYLKTFGSLQSYWPPK